MLTKRIAYLETQRRQAPWDALLKPLVEELSNAIGSDKLRLLMVQAGMRAGQELALPACESIEQLEQHANEHWVRLGWGVVTFVEGDDCLEINHDCAPAHTPAPDSFCDFLEGVYQQWFVSAGAGDQLRVHKQPSNEDGTFLYRLMA